MNWVDTDVASAAGFEFESEPIPESAREARSRKAKCDGERVRAGVASSGTGGIFHLNQHSVRQISR